MGSEPVEDLPDDLEAWVTERAADDSTTREEVVRRLMAAHRLLDERPGRLDETAVSDPEFGNSDEVTLGGPDPLGDRTAADVDDVRARVDNLEARVEGLDADLDEKITDVRERVIQVKRETDAKAPADHDHPELERRMDEGFTNYEEVLEYLTERTDHLADAADDRGAKLRTVANAVVGLRKRVDAIEGILEERAAAAELRESANRQGISEASCESCGESVDLGLLDDPTCPHCGSPFDGVESGGWFRSNRLTVGDLPALESTASDDAGTAPEPDAEGPSDDGEATTQESDAKEQSADGEAAASTATGSEETTDVADGDASGTRESFDFSRETSRDAADTAEAPPDPDDPERGGDGSDGDPESPSDGSDEGGEKR